jgi:hypothetical protein
MTRPLDPEIKALRAVERAVRPLSLDAKRRLSEWLLSRTADEKQKSEQVGARDG